LFYMIETGAAVILHIRNTSRATWDD